MTAAEHKMTAADAIAAARAILAAGVPAAIAQLAATGRKTPAVRSKQRPRLRSNAYQACPDRR